MGAACVRDEVCRNTREWRWGVAGGTLELRVAGKPWKTSTFSSMATIVREDNVLRTRLPAINPGRSRGLRKKPGVLTQISTRILDIPPSLGSREPEAQPQ